MLHDTSTASASEAPTAAKEGTPTIQSLAAQALKKGGNDVLKATEIMEKMVREDPYLWMLWLDSGVRTACYTAVSGVQRRDGHKCWTTKQPSSSSERRRVVALSDGTAASLLNLPINGRTRLGDATAEDLDQAIHFYSAQALDMGVKAAWFALIKKGLPEGKKVKEVFTNAKLAKLKEAASHA
jgi:hypothetical protein